MPARCQAGHAHGATLPRSGKRVQVNRSGGLASPMLEHVDFWRPLLICRREPEGGP